ncbi:MAG: nucleoside-diphosphate-sugar epimerase [Verrucomicrobiales bacterium]|jgi:nucleoside-diphosphate-sugar epimerase
MRIFITGASGFVGRVLIQQLLADSDHEIVALSRQAQPDSLEDSERVRWIRADLLDIAVCREALADCDAIVHLAAITGKVDPRLYDHVIVEGTRRLLVAAKDAGNLPILNVSTIAVKFSELRSYPYAKAKQRAERLVRQSGLRFTNVRPTIVLGPGSGAWEGLAKLALAPVGIVFGKGEVEIQPIHVDDLVGSLAAILNEDRFKGESLDFGGPDKLTMNQFFEAIREDAGKKPSRILHAPFPLVLPMLRFAEKVAYRFLPLTVGQLSSFRFSSVPESNTFQLRRSRSMMGVKEMIAATSAAKSSAENNPGTECDVFCRYLIGERPTAYVVEKYRAGIESEVFKQAENSAFDEKLIQLAAKRPLLTGFADAYCRFFRPNSIVRRKLVLLLAILESTTFAAKVDEANDRGVLGFLVASGFATLGFAARLVGGIAVFLPLQFLTREPVSE